MDGGVKGAPINCTYKLVGEVGFEPTNLFFPKEARTARLLYSPMKLGCPLGFEPRLTDSQTGVLTVDTMDTQKLNLDRLLIRPDLRAGDVKQYADS